MKIGYARVSTQEQNLDLQTQALNSAGCEKIYLEKASGAQRDRPELKEALNYMRQGDILIVWKLDRLARSMNQLIETISLLDQKGIGLHSITEAFDTTTAGGKLIFHIFGALAEFERAVIRERTLAGLKVAREQGRIGGRPRSISGSDITMAKAMLKEPGITIAQIARRLNVSPATLYRHIPGGRSAI